MSQVHALQDIASRALESALAAGAEQVAVRVAQGRSIEVKKRQGEIERILDAASSGLTLQLFVDGKYATHSTSDLRPEALDAFVPKAMTLTSYLGRDPFRGLADPELYAGRAELDLELYDPAMAEITPAQRLDLLQRTEAAAQAVGGPIISVETTLRDGASEEVRLHSNGFFGTATRTSVSLSASVSVQDPNERRPSDAAWAATRYFADLPDPATIGAEASQRALSRIGQTKLPSATLPVVFENRVAPQMISYLLGALSGAAIQQQRSFLLGKLDQSFASPLLHLTDDPHIPRGLGSRFYDGDGIASHPRTLVEAGTLRAYLIDVYYGRKLEMPPTSGSTSNLSLSLGTRPAAEMVADIERGIYVTSLLGGNVDYTRGDFSHGVSGFAIENGKLTVPIGEMNISGNHLSLWQGLVEVGNDPFPYSSYLIPTMRFDGVSVSGL